MSLETCVGGALCYCCSWVGVLILHAKLEIDDGVDSCLGSSAKLATYLQLTSFQWQLRACDAISLLRTVQ
jgi:hypothetical protein